MAARDGVKRVPAITRNRRPNAAKYAELRSGAGEDQAAQQKFGLTALGHLVGITERDIDDRRAADDG